MFDTLKSLLRRPSRDRAGWCYLGNGVGVALTHFNRKIFLPGDDFGMTPEIALRGRWEPHVEAVLRRLLKPGMVAVELGASIGFHTLVMGEAVGPRGHIHAFEPFPKVLPLLQQTLLTNGFNGRVTLREMAALDQPGQVAFAADPAHAGSAHLAIAHAAPGYSTHFTVPAVRLDDVLADLPSADLLRMDIEGTEGLALHGAQALLARSPGLHIVMEWAPVMLAARCDVAALADWLDRLGFRCQRILRGGRLAAVSGEEMPGLPHSDLLLSRGPFAG